MIKAVFNEARRPIVFSDWVVHKIMKKFYIKTIKISFKETVFDIINSNNTLKNQTSEIKKQIYKIYLKDKKQCFKELFGEEEYSNKLFYQYTTVIKKSILDNKKNVLGYNDIGKELLNIIQGGSSRDMAWYRESSAFINEFYAKAGMECELLKILNKLTLI